MNPQAELFIGTAGGLVAADPFCQHHSPTSREAAKRISRCRSKLQQRVYRFVLNRGAHGATDEEISVGMNLRPDTSRARRVELRDFGLIRESGARRPTTSGRMAAVWVAILLNP